MNAHVVPSDIIYKIVRYALYDQDNEQREFKKGLKILAVCPEWRRAVLPIVYRNLYIVSNRYKNVRDDNYDSMHDLADKLSTVKVETNIGLIQSQNYVELVRILNIDVRFDTLPFLGHAKIANVLSRASAIWPNVHTLNMAMYSFARGSTYEDIGSHTSIISDIAARFTQLMPNVRHLIFQECYATPIVWKLYGYIAGAYNKQLEKLSSKHPIVVPSDLISTNLKHVNIWFNDITDYQPPSINPRVLESLMLFDVFGTTFWDSFCTGAQSSVIEFLNLKELRVCQHRNDTSVDMNHNAYQLRFPCLQKLYIDSYTNTLPWFFLQQPCLRQ